MDSTDIQSVQSKLAEYLAELEEKRSNPFAGSPLEALKEQIKAMKSTYGLSHKSIAEKLSELGVETSEQEIKRFCAFAFRRRGGRKPSASDASASSKGSRRGDAGQRSP